MCAKHAGEISISHALHISDFIFQLASDIHKQDRLENDNRTLKVYKPVCITGNYLYFIDIYNGQTMYVFSKLNYTTF
jgi:hypothetical protein